MESSRPDPQPLTPAECLELLAACTIGRIAVVHEGYPVVLPVRGRLSSVVPQSRLDPHPLVDVDRDAWRVVEPHTVTGRRIAPDPDRWPFLPAGYL